MSESVKAPYLVARLLVHELEQSITQLQRCCVSCSSYPGMSIAAVLTCAFLAAAPMLTDCSVLQQNRSLAKQFAPATGGCCEGIAVAAVADGDTGAGSGRTECESASVLL